MPDFHDHDDDDKDAGGDAGKRRFDEFDCPECDAYNPVGDGFVSGDEVRCCYCGEEFLVRVNDEGRVRFVPN